MALPIPRQPSAPDLGVVAEQRREQDDRATVWAFLWTLFFFKMATVVLIYWFAKADDPGAFLVATTWFWFVIPLLAIAGPLLFRYRLRKVRAKREQLRRAEWLVDEDHVAARTSLGRRP